MNDILKFLALLIGIGCVAVVASIMLPPPDGGIFAYTILLSAIALALFICSGLSEGRINSARDVMHCIGARHPLRLTLAAYVLGWSMAACTTVLIYRAVSEL
ncbi:hypothetical protein EGJ27_14515 [Pseudomonas sp. v388]|uniref:hypothetical protein n=1 Tax=Pseudomonas sp. v388 TaxID=2479849 RepID=UPI000F7B3C93|nr:hypothetical protein [Pseudomonas sp. v388]RRV06960.1 hypothetical protein EGJ27_14515 [Pseudomonas sp. v388]